LYLMAAKYGYIYYYYYYYYYHRRHHHHHHHNHVVSLSLERVLRPSLHGSLSS
jgi:hypothetical protein